MMGVAILGAFALLAFLAWAWCVHRELAKDEPPGYLARRFIGGESNAEIMARDNAET